MWHLIATFTSPPKVVLAKTGQWKLKIWRKIVDDRTVRLPQNWNDFPAVPSNTQELALLLSNELIAQAPGDKIIVVPGVGDLTQLDIPCTLEIPSVWSALAQWYNGRLTIERAWVRIIPCMSKQQKYKYFPIHGIRQKLSSPESVVTPTPTFLATPWKRHDAWCMFVKYIGYFST